MVLMIHGMDIDVCSKICPHFMLLAQVDLITGKKSFVSMVFFGITDGDGACKRFDNYRSSVGYGTLVSNGSKISNAIIHPLTHVQKSIARHDIDRQQVYESRSSNSRGLIISGCLYASFIPSYELLVSFLRLITKLEVVGAIASCLLLQTMAFVILFAIYSCITLAHSKDLSGPWSYALYNSYHSMNSSFCSFTLSSVFLASPAYNCIMKIFAVKLEGRAILFSMSSLYEHCHLTFADMTIVDTSDVMGHYFLYDRITIEPSKVSGILPLLLGNAHGPYRSFVGNYHINDKVKNQID